MYEDDGYYITEDGFEKVPYKPQKGETDWKFIVIVIMSLLSTLFMVVPWAVGIAYIVRKLFY